MGAGILILVGEGFRSFKVIRAPLTVSVCAALTLSAPGQSREIYKVLAQEFNEGAYTQTSFTFLFSIIAAILVWLIARNVTLVCAKDAVGMPGVEGVLLRWLPRICGALLPLGMGIGLWMASTDLTLGYFSDKTIERIPQLNEIRDQVASTVL